MTHALGPPLVLALLSLAPFAAAREVPSGLRFREVTVQGARHRFAVWVPPGYDPARAWPCVVFLHGAGECGTDAEKPTRIGLPPAAMSHPERWPCLIVIPQKPLEDEEWEEREALVLAALARVEREFRVDRDRVALTGMSQGGHGVWMIAARHPDRFSCLAPVCGYGRAQTVARRVANLPVWAFHGLKDDVVDPADTRHIVAALRAERTSRGLDPEGARATLYPELNHGCWDEAYGGSGLAEWMLSQHRAAR